MGRAILPLVVASLVLTTIPMVCQNYRRIDVPASTRIVAEGLTRIGGIARPVAMTTDGQLLLEGYLRNPGNRITPFRNGIAVIGVRTLAGGRPEVVRVAF